MAEAHVRIDEGIKRGPRKPKPSKTALEASGRIVSVALRPLSNLSPEERLKVANSVLARYTNGEQVADIAPEFNLSDVTIYALLLRDHEETWRDTQTARALAKYATSVKGLETAGDPLSLARARELVRTSQWELERLLHRLYGQKQEVKLEVDMRVLVSQALTGDASELLSRIRGAVQPTMIDVTPVLPITQE